LEVIRRMAEVLGVNFDDLAILARRTPPDIKDYVQESPEVRRMLRKAKKAGFRDWDQVEKLIEGQEAERHKRKVE